MNIKAQSVWDRVVVTSLTLSFGFAIYLAQEAYTGMRKDIQALQQAKTEVALEVTRIKTTEEMHYQEIVRLLNDIKEQMRRR